VPAIDSHLPVWRQHRNWVPSRCAVTRTTRDLHGLACSTWPTI